MKRKKTHKTTKNTQPKNKQQMKANAFNDTLHPDGSKTYQTLYRGYITIENPEFVKEIESILEGNYTGWGYMPRLEKFVSEGKDVYNEFQKVVFILD